MHWDHGVSVPTLPVFHKIESFCCSSSDPMDSNKIEYQASTGASYLEIKRYRTLTKQAVRRLNIKRTSANTVRKMREPDRQEVRKEGEEGM